MHAVDAILVFHAYLFDELLFACEDVDGSEGFRVAYGEAEGARAESDAIEAVGVDLYCAGVVSSEICESCVVVPWRYIEAD